VTASDTQIISIQTDGKHRCQFQWLSSQNSYPLHSWTAHHFIHSSYYLIGKWEL
jgi:hypothetical protein